MFWRKQCPFCQDRPYLTRLPPSHGVEVLYNCTSCNTCLTILPDGNFDIIPTTAMLATNSDSPIAPTCINPPSTPNTWAPLLCSQCISSQSVLLHIINNAPEELLEVGMEGELGKWRRGVEARYPLCGACQFAVAERLKQVAFRVRCSKMSVGSVKGNRRRVVVKAPYSFGIVAVGAVEVILSIAIFGLQHYAIHHSFDAGIARITLIVLYALIMGFVSKNFLLTVLVASCKYHNSSVHYLPFWSLLSITAFAILRKFYRPKNLVKIDSIDNENVRPSLHQTPSLSSLSLSNTLQNTHQRSSIPELFQVKPKPAVSSVKLRPTRLDYSAQSSGLEDLFSNTIRLHDVDPPKMAAISSGTLKQTLISIVLLAIRLWFGEEQLAFVLMIYCASFYFGPFWQDRLATAVKTVYVGVTLARLTWLALLVTDSAEFELPAWTGTACDLFLLSFR